MKSSGRLSPSSGEINGRRLGFLGPLSLAAAVVALWGLRSERFSNSTEQVAAEVELLPEAPPRDLPEDKTTDRFMERLKRGRRMAAEGGNSIAALFRRVAGGDMAEAELTRLKTARSWSKNYGLMPGLGLDAFGLWRRTRKS